MKGESMKKLLALALLATINTQCSTTHRAGKEITEQVKKLRKKKNPEDGKKLLSAQVDGEMPHLSAIVQKATKTLGLEGVVSHDSFSITTSLSDNVWLEEQKANQPALLGIPYGLHRYSDAVLTAIIGRAVKLFALDKKHRIREIITTFLAQAGTDGLGILMLKLADKKGWWPEWAVRTQNRTRLARLMTILPFVAASFGTGRIASRFYSRKLAKAADEEVFEHWPQEMEQYLEQQQATTKLVAKQLKQRMEDEPSKKISLKLKHLKKHVPSYKQTAGLMDYEPTHDERLEHLLEHTGQI